MSDLYFQIKCSSGFTGKIVFKLYEDDCPITCRNFRELCTGKNGFGYKDSKFHRIITEFMAQGGDFTKHNGTGGKSIYGPKFNDENFKYKHNEPYALSMANCGPNTNGSQFFITFVACPWLDGKHTVFGKVVRGQEVVDYLGSKNVSTKNGKPQQEVTIIDCGEVYGTNYWGGEPAKPNQQQRSRQSPIQKKLQSPKAHKSNNQKQKEGQYFQKEKSEKESEDENLNTFKKQLRELEISEDTISVLLIQKVTRWEILNQIAKEDLKDLNVPLGDIVKIMSVRN